MQGAFRTAARRLGWGVADQALSSITNFALSIAVARTVSAHRFGAFSLAFATYLLLLGISRALTSEPLMVRFSAVDASVVRSNIPRQGGASLLIGILAAIPVGGLALGLDPPAREVFLALAVSLPGLLLQDSWRYAFFTAGHGVRAFMNDLVWGSVLLLSLTALIINHQTSAEVFVLAWGLSAGAAAIVGMAQLRVRPRITQASSWVRQNRDLVGRYLGEFASANGAFQATMYVVGALAGLAAVGFLRGGLILLAPVMVVYMGVRLAAIPEAARIVKRSVTHFHRVILSISLSLAAGAAAWGLLLLLMPGRIGEGLLGASWRGAQPLILPLTIMYVAQGLEVGLFIGVRALAAAKLSLKARLIEAALTASGGILGALLGGALGAAWGLAAAFWLESWVWWWFFREAERTHVIREGSSD